MSSFYGGQLETQIEMELFSLGFRPDLKGFNYIRDAVIMLIDDADMIYRITKVVYPKVAKIGKTTPSVVEHAIRRSIEVTWDENSLLYNHFSHYLKRPTNRTVLAFLCKYLNAELSKYAPRLIIH